MKSSNKNLFAVFLLIATLMPSVRATEKPLLGAKELYEACKYTIEKLEEGPDASTESKRVYQCLYYVMAASDMAHNLSIANLNGVYLCVPENYAFQDVARAIVARGVTNPIMLSGNKVPASSLAYFSLADVYGSNKPCEFDKAD